MNQTTYTVTNKEGEITNKRIPLTKEQVKELRKTGFIVEVWRMDLTETENELLLKGTKKDGKQYTVRANRDRIFTPGEWNKTEKQFSKKTHPIHGIGNHFTYDFLINTGARHKEASNVKKEDIDFDNLRIVLRVTKIKAKKGETRSRPRIVPISSQFAKRLKKACSKLRPEDKIPIRTLCAANHSLKKAIQKAGIQDYYMFSIHNIRKTLENWLLAVGVREYAVWKHMGHTPNVAAEAYIQPDIFTAAEKAEIRKILGDLYSQ